MDREEEIEATRAVAKEIEEILGRVDALPVLDARCADELVSYDEFGVPKLAAQIRPQSALGSNHQ